MPKSRSLIGRAALAACLILSCARSASAQQPDQPVASPAPDQPAFLPRGDYHMAASVLSNEDIRFTWDIHFGGSIDLVDYRAGRVGIYIDYQAVCGSELRPFDPNQANYTLEGFGSKRINDTTEIVGIFHHVSRHLSDRPKDFAVAMNMIGARALKHLDTGGTTVDLDLEGGFILQHSFVDYSWIGELHVQARHPINDHVAVYSRGMGQLIGTDGSIPDRGTLAGGFVEAGVRIKGTGATMELFAGFERRIDAYPLDRMPKQWALAGLRLVSR